MASPKRKPSGGIGTPVTGRPASTRDINGNLKQKAHPNPVSDRRKAATAASTAKPPTRTPTRPGGKMKAR